MLALNLLYLAWAGWIDVPASGLTANQSRSTLPELVLASEHRGVDQTQPSRPDGAPAVAQTVSSVSGGDDVPGIGRSTRCVSVGPFADIVRAARGAALLRGRGFNPRQRAEAGGVWEGFWVYIGGLESEADEARVVKTLERAGVTDARVMPESPEGRRVSVGLFSDEERAQKRAQAVKRLGYAADVVERRQPGTVYWVDLDLGQTERTVPTEGLLSGEGAGARLEIRVCPTQKPAPAAPLPVPLPRDARPAATTADAGLPSPG